MKCSDALSEAPKFINKVLLGTPSEVTGPEMLLIKENKSVPRLPSRTVFKQADIHPILDDLVLLATHLKKYHVDARSPVNKNTLLHEAISLEMPEAIGRLLARGASPYLKNQSGERVIESPFFQKYIRHILESKSYDPSPNKPIIRVYLAGPEVFLEYSQAAGDFIKAQLRIFNKSVLKYKDYNLEGLFPFDSMYTPKNMDFEDGLRIYEGDVALMEQADAIIANMVRFRGPGMDGGTAFEMGYMVKSKKFIVGYYDERPYYDNHKPNRLYQDKIVEHMGGKELKKVTLNDRLHINYDNDRLHAESFQMPDNLMMVAPASSVLSGQRPPTDWNIPSSSWDALFVLKERIDENNRAKAKIF